VTALLLDYPPLLAIVLFVSLMLAVEAGYRLSLATGANRDEDRHEQISAARDALGILLSLLLGFTLAMVLPRFDLRRQLVLDEANAIGTASLRAGLLLDTQRAQVRALLLQYVRARQAYSQANATDPDLAPALTQTKSLQSALWQQAEQAARTNQTPSPLSSSPL
jgi:hypothetical protein